MKKTAAILLIISFSQRFIINLIEIPQVLEYSGGFEFLMHLIGGLFGNFALILLGISLLIEKKLPAFSKNESTSNEVNLNSNDVPSTGLNIISFLIPLVGLIIYLTEKDKAPKKAKSAGKAAIWGVGVSILLGIISVIISIVMVNSMY